MGKIVKFCSTCEEGFAEKFSFCPNCANELTAFELNPVDVKDSAEKVKAPGIVAKEADLESPAVFQPDALEVSAPPVKSEETVFEPVDLLSATPDDDEFEIDFPDDEPVEIMTKTSSNRKESDVQEIVVEQDSEPEIETVVAAAKTPLKEVETVVASAKKPLKQVPVYSGKSEKEDKGRFHPAAGGAGGYSVTVISERSSSTRNGLLMMSFALIAFGFVGVMIFSLFNNFDDIPA